MRNRVLRFLPIALTAAFISACADAPTTVNRTLPSGPSLTSVDDAVANTVELEVLKVCKVWVNASDADIGVTVSGSTNHDGVYTVPTATGTPPNTCRAVAIEGALAGGGAGVNITVTEDDPGAGFSTTWTVDNSDNTLDAAGAGLSAATLIGGSGINGAVITFTNTLTPPGDEGCTPGYWKNHPASWPATGYAPGQTLESVFDVPDALGLDNATLLEALSFTGGAGQVGAAKILLRAAVAALLNAAHPGVDYGMTTAEIIADVNAALAGGDRDDILELAADLDELNNAGCPIS